MSYSTRNSGTGASKLKGTGRSGRAQVGADQELFWSTEAFEFATKEDAIDIAAWNAAVLAGSIHYIGQVQEMDANDAEPAYYEATIGSYRLKTAKAKRIRQYRLIESAITHSHLTSFDGRNGRLFIKTTEDYLKAVSVGDAVKGARTSQFDVGLATAATPETPSFTPIDVTFDDPVSDDIAIFEDKLDFEFADVDQVFEADVEVSGVASNGTNLTFTVAFEKDGSGVPLAGVTEAMVSVKDANGGEITKTVVQNADGVRYDIDATTALTGATVSLLNIVTISGILWTSEEVYASVSA